MPRASSIRFTYGVPPIPVRFLERPNRYLAIVEPIAGGARFEAHVPNPGRMEELLVPMDTNGWVVASGGPTRRTAYDLVAVRHGRAIASIDTRIGNRLIARALDAGAIPTLPRGLWRAEVPRGAHRFDFALNDPDSGRITHLVEVKCSNLRVGRAAYFPDAPTLRGRLQLLALAAAIRRGMKATVLFVVQRPDVVALRPNRALDPEFGRAMDRAGRAGVRFLAYRIWVGPGEVAIDRRIPVDLRTSTKAFSSAPVINSG